VLLIFAFQLLAVADFSFTSAANLITIFTFKNFLDIN